MLEIIQVTPDLAFAYTDNSLKQDSIFMLEALKLYSLALNHADESLKKDSAFMLEAMKIKKLSIQEAMRV